MRPVEHRLLIRGVRYSAIPIMVYVTFFLLRVPSMVTDFDTSSGITASHTKAM
jgi:hypothetical protein